MYAGDVLFFSSGVKTLLVNLILTLTRAWSTNGITGVVVVTAGVVVFTAGVVVVTAGVVVVTTGVVVVTAGVVGVVGGVDFSGLR